MAKGEKKNKESNSKIDLDVWHRWAIALVGSSPAHTPGAVGGIGRHGDLVFKKFFPKICAYGVTGSHASLRN